MGSLAAMVGMTTQSESRLYQRAERVFALPMLVLSVLLIPVLLLPIAWSGMPHDFRVSLDITDYVIWGAFAAEYLVMLGLARSKLDYFKHHIVQLLLVALPLLRPLRIAWTLRLVRSAVGVGRAAQLSRRSLVMRAGLYAPAAAAGVTIVIASLVFDAERRVDGSNIKTFGDALWWAVTTITTVGYGDHYPVTPAGKALAFVLMISGLALLGLVTATIAAAFVRWTEEPIEQAEEQVQEEQSDMLELLLLEVRALRAEVEQLKTMSTRDRGTRSRVKPSP